MNRDALAAVITPLAEHLLRQGANAHEADASGLTVERVGTGGEDDDPTIDVFVWAPEGADASRLGGLGTFLQRLPTELWFRVRVLDSNGRAALLRPEVSE